MWTEILKDINDWLYPIMSCGSNLRLYIPVLEHLGIVLFELFGSFETVLEVALVDNFVLELVDSFVWEPIIR